VNPSKIRTGTHWGAPQLFFSIFSRGSLVVVIFSSGCAIYINIFSLLYGINSYCVVPSHVVYWNDGGIAGPVWSSAESYFQPGKKKEK
jgi:hypothetical protein